LSTEQDKIRSIADRIAQRLAGADGAQGERRAGAESDELTQLRAALRELQQRLAHVESHVAHGDDRLNSPSFCAEKPEPWHVGHDFGSVPGSAPVQWSR